MGRNLRILIGIALPAMLMACTAIPTQASGHATITAALDMGTGGPSFAATVYAQEVHTGKTFHGLMSAGGHGLVILPTSAPVSFEVDAPGTYIFYAVLINEDSYHFGATGCQPMSDCHADGLVALDVVPGGSYKVYIGDQSALIPPTGVPVRVPWHK